MVIGERFAWAHLPKAGGNATLAMFQLFPDLVQFADPVDGNEKHALFRDREEQISGRVLAMNIRRLPSWVLSRAHHINRRGLHPDYQPLPMQSPHEMASSTFPDHRLATYTDDGRLEIGRWMRLEMIVDDFLAFVSEFGPVSDEQRRLVRELGPANEGSYDRDLSHWFTPDHLDLMYRGNPVWAELERRLYGGLLSLE